MEEGTLLGFVIYLEGVTIDPGRIEVIKAIVLPHNKKTMQYFLGKINFVRRFISDFAEDFCFKWTKERREAFDKIKEFVSTHFHKLERCPLSPYFWP